MDKKLRTLICLFAFTITLAAGPCSSNTQADFRSGQVSSLSQQNLPSAA